MTALEVLPVLVIAILPTLLLVPATVLFTQVFLAWLPAPNRKTPPGSRPTVAVLIPAHNEAEGIAATLAAIVPQLAIGDRLLVVADNCADTTARIAADNGAEVIERIEPDRRGKGFALAFGVDYLRSAPPGVLLILDADCCLHAGGLDRIGRLAAAIGRPIQALDLMQALPETGLNLRIAEFAWLVKNWVRPLGSARLGLPCQLMGTGMAFPWALIRNAQLATGELVEDMKLGIDLALAGYPAQFCPQALVTSRFPDSTRAQSTQRTRWEHGHLGMIANEAPRLFREALRRRDLRLLGMALDLSVPPLALLSALVALVFLLGLVSWAWGGSVWPLVLATTPLVVLVAAIVLAWVGWGRSVLPLGALLSVPLYILAKLPIYLKFWTHRQKDWVRTGRE